MAYQVCDALKLVRDRRIATYSRAARDYVRERYDLETVCLPNQMAWISETLRSRTLCV